MGESSKGDANIFKVDLLDWLKEPTLIEPFLGEAPFVESCGDGVVVGVTPSIKHIDLSDTEYLTLPLFHAPYFPQSPIIYMHFNNP